MEVEMHLDMRYASWHGYNLSSFEVYFGFIN
jgi:hypothetical protein